jgi:hypothetical protein
MFNQEKAQKLAELQALLDKRDTEKKDNISKVGVKR